MKRYRGFKLRRRLTPIFKWVTRTRNPNKYRPLDHPTRKKINTISKLCKWGSSIKRGLFSSSRTGYLRVGQDPDETKRLSTPKGHLAVYVGEQEDDTRRVLVPVIYFNHPLFGRLLKEAEEVYGFEYPGRITIPCPMSEFENVKTRIDAGRKFVARPLRHQGGLI